MKTQLVVTVILRAREGLEVIVRQELSRVISAERAAGAAHGLIAMTLHEDLAQSGRILLLERWESQDAFDRFHAEHEPAELKTFLARQDELFAEPIGQELTFWSSF